MIKVIVYLAFQSSVNDKVYNPLFLTSIGRDRDLDRLTCCVCGIFIYMYMYISYTDARIYVTTLPFSFSLSFRVHSLAK